MTSPMFDVMMLSLKTGFCNVISLVEVIISYDFIRDFMVFEVIAY